MRTFLLFAALCFSACAQAPVPVTVELDGFEAEEGRIVRVAVTNLTREREVGRQAATIVDGGLELPIAGVEPGQAYRIDGWVDAVGDKICDVATEFTFSATVGANQLDIDPITFVYERQSAVAPAACESFGAGRMIVEYADVPADQRIEARLFDDGGALVMTVGQLTEHGFGTLELPGAVLPDTHYELLVWVDLGPFHVCGPEDQVLRRVTGAVGTPGQGLLVTLGDREDSPADGCARFAE